MGALDQQIAPGVGSRRGHEAGPDFIVIAAGKVAEIRGGATEERDLLGLVGSKKMFSCFFAGKDSFPSGRVAGGRRLSCLRGAWSDCLSSPSPRPSLSLAALSRQ